MICSFASEFPRIILIWPHRINWVQDSLSHSLPLKKRHCFLPTSQLQQQSGIISVWWSFVSRLQSLVLWNGNSLACKGPRIWQLTSWTFLNCNSTESKSISSASYSNSICWGGVSSDGNVYWNYCPHFFFFIPPLVELNLVYLHTILNRSVEALVYLSWIQQFQMSERSEKQKHFSSCLPIVLLVVGLFFQR